MVFGVSTFSWLATWLSARTQQIFMPVSGIFNPAQLPDIDLLPLVDEGNRFFEFPNEQWSANADQRTRVVATGQEFAELPRSELRRRRRDANASLDHLRQEANVPTLLSLRRQRDRARRRVERTMQEYTDLKRGDDGAAGGPSNGSPPGIVAA